MSEQVVRRGWPTGAKVTVILLVLVCASLAAALVLVSIELREAGSGSLFSPDQLRTYQQQKSEEKQACYAAGGTWDPTINTSGGFVPDGGCRQ